MLNFYKLPKDYLKFEGADRLDLINRLSTNQVIPLETYKGVKTILTSDKGRFVDLLTLFNFGDFVFAECSFNNAVNVITHLDKYTIMDDFTITNLSGTHETILFFGKNSESFISKLTGGDISAQKESGFLLTSAHDAIALRSDDIPEGIEFTYSLKDKDDWSTAIFSEANKSEFQLNEFTDEQFEIMRIESGIPKFGAEMTELTNPLECGLNKYVSFTKGCYIGQEVIARLDAYDKISKHMVGLKIPAAPADMPAFGDKITLEGKECGFVTSAAVSEKYGPVGLGFVKTIFLDYGKKYSIKHNESLIDCSLVKLPFTEQT
ncbi:MAG TPA: glycine cleavage T C-terminal barrel domain-containing protein [Ignavibacteria bacterium]|nr:glycine cleavage T C-terminal barrel domain-containing protein [Ignavibacteria bacterium]